MLTLVAYVAVLVTGRCPQATFDFNAGVLRRTWRVGYYGYQALGTDRYSPASRCLPGPRWRGRPGSP